MRNGAGPTLDDMVDQEVFTPLADFFVSSDFLPERFQPVTNYAELIQGNITGFSRLSLYKLALEGAISKVLPDKLVPLVVGPSHVRGYSVRTLRPGTLRFTGLNDRLNVEFVYAYFFFGRRVPVVFAVSLGVMLQVTSVKAR
ncbi:hypothetical protein HYU18_01690 [Candidatus Woesearchaeota archaeon]|nr:hypothetical protein [Candidatus Woesearchaeota archaeon]